MSFSTNCRKRLEKHWCQEDADCRSALYNMYECNNCPFCGRETIPNAGGLAWTSSGIGSIECTTTSGNPVYCDNNTQKCKYGMNEYEMYCGVLECE